MSTFIQNFQYKALTLLIAICAVSMLYIAAVNKRHVNLGTTLISNAKEGEIFLTSCDIFLEGDDKSYEGDCGTLIVRENRENTNSRLIPLPVRRIRALSDTPTEPIFWFEGGPGGPNTMIYQTDGLLENHDFIMIGYRGIEGEVNLVCSEIGDAARNVTGNFLSNEALASYAHSATECVNRYISNGVDLDGYSMNQTIEDMEDARKAMGYERINLFGNSYGTRLEMLYQWRYPENLNRVVQVAVNPPGNFVFDPRAIEKLLHDYTVLCAKDEYCHSRTSNLYETMKHVSNNMPKSWMGIPINLEAIRFLTVFSLMESMKTSGETVPLNGPAIIDLWLDASEGDYSGMALASLSLPLFLPPMAERGHFLAMGASAPDYLDDDRDYSSEFKATKTLLGSPFSLFISGMIDGWPASTDQSIGTVQLSDVETLLINGSIDGSTPVQFGRDELLPYLTNGHLFVVKDQGHTETFWHSQPKARARILNEFFDTGKVDSSLFKYQSPDFEVETTWGGIVRIFVIPAVFLLIICLILLTFCIRWANRYITMKFHGNV